MNPEEKARIKIDEELTQAGWVIQDRKDFNRNASLGVAVRGFFMHRELRQMFFSSKNYHQ